MEKIGRSQSDSNEKHIQVRTKHITNNWSLIEREKQGVWEMIIKYSEDQKALITLLLERRVNKFYMLVALILKVQQAIFSLPLTVVVVILKKIC